MFSLVRVSKNTTQFSLSIGAFSRIVAWFLSLPVVRGGVQGQISREVEHIRQSMEAVATVDTTG
jgi:hypothetical protein